MKYLSVCSGIEAATVAWHPLGWEPVAFSEIEPFPAAVLAHHYPDTPNLGDMTKFKEWPNATFDVLVGGTPCQSFSVAGLRKGLDDPRGNLMLTYLAIADRYRPEWLVWENVPGVLSSNGGKDFGTFLSGLGELGYGFAYRVLDAQYFGVPQRRRRVFVVGHLGDWRRAAAVLFEQHSLSGHPAPRREKREKTAGNVAIGVDEECNATIEGFGPLLRGGQGGTRQAVCFQQNTRDEVRHINGDGKIAGALAAESGAKQTNYICMSTGQASAEIGIGIGTTLNCNHEAQIVGCYSMITANTNSNGLGVREIAPTLDRAQPCAIAFEPGIAKRDGSENRFVEGVTPTLRSGMGDNQTAVATNMQVRRLTPGECESLQGFPQGYTNIPWRNKPEAPDGPRYKALGNSMAVPCMRWIGERIQMVSEIGKAVAA